MRIQNNDSNLAMKQFNNRLGFTFIELILYIGIVTIMLSAIIPFAWNIIGSGAKSSSEQEVFSQARYVSERIKYEIRNANSINSVNSPINTISLNTSTNPTAVIDLSNGKVRIKYGASAAISLNSDDTTASSLTFTNYTSLDNKTKHIQFTFTMGDTGTSGRQEYKVPAVNIEGSAELRSN